MKIKFLMLTLLAVAGLCLVSCGNDEDDKINTLKCELSLYPNGLSTNEDYAKKVVAFYQSAIGSDANVTYTKASGSGSGYDLYNVNFEYKYENYESMTNKIANLNYTSIEDALPEGNYRVDFNNVYTSKTYSRNLLAGTWKCQVNGKDFILTIKDTRTSEVKSESVWENPYVLTYGDDTYKDDVIAYKATYSDGKVKAIGDISKRDSSGAVLLTVRIQMTKGVNQEGTCKLTLFEIEHKTMIEDSVVMAPQVSTIVLI